MNRKLVEAELAAIRVEIRGLIESRFNLTFDAVEAKCWARLTRREVLLLSRIRHMVDGTAA